MITRVVAVILFVACTPLFGCAQNTTIHIRLHEGTELEQRGQQQLERILESHKLDNWIFTDSVLIQSFVIPHSHPILTLNTRYLDDDNAQLATFLHEQVHWFAADDTQPTENVIETFRGMYSDVPVRGGEGARDEYSTYLHLMICWLEFDGLRQLVGEEEARAVFKEKTYYTWIYKKILEEGDRIGDVVKKHGMVIG